MSKIEYAAVIILKSVLGFSYRGVPRESFGECRWLLNRQAYICCPVLTNSLFLLNGVVISLYLILIISTEIQAREAES